MRLPPTSRPGSRCRRSPAAIGSTSNRPRPTVPLTSVQFDVGWYSEGSADTPDLLETSIDKPEYLAGDTMVVSVNARSAGRLTINVLGDRLLTTQSISVKEGTAQVKIPVGKDWGTGAYVVATLRRPLDAAASADARTGDRPEVVRHRQERPARLTWTSRRRRWCAPEPR